MSVLCLGRSLPSYAGEAGGLVLLSEVWTFGKSQHGRLQMSLQEVHGDEPGCVIVGVSSLWIRSRCLRNFEHVVAPL